MMSGGVMKLLAGLDAGLHARLFLSLSADEFAPIYVDPNV